MKDLTPFDILDKLQKDTNETIDTINIKKFMVEGDDDYDENSPSYNFARWATKKEFQSSLRKIEFNKNAYYDKSGIPLLSDGKTAFVDVNDSHTLIIGASGSKKTRLFIMPSILSLAQAGESMVITDPKSELYDRTASYLENKGYNIIAVNFRDESIGDSWNPLWLPYNFFGRGEFDTSIGLLNDFAHVAVPRSSSHSDPFWDDSARSAFLGLLVVLFSCSRNIEEINLKSLLNLRFSSFDKFSSNNSFLLDKLFSMAGYNNIAYTYLSGTIIAPEKTFFSILSTLDSHLAKFIIRPRLTEMMCKNNFNFYDIADTKTAIFLIMPDEKTTYHGLVSIFIKQCYEALIFHAQKSEDHKLMKRVNFILDEFSSLPQMKDFPAMIAAARSRNIRFNIVVQSEQQLKNKYEYEAETIKGNCNNWVFLTSKELLLLNEISNLCDKRKNGNSLITISKLQRLSKENGEALVIRERLFPFIANLADINSYDNENFVIREQKGQTVSEIQVFNFDYYLKNTDIDVIKQSFSEKLLKNSSKMNNHTNYSSNDILESTLDYYDKYKKTFSAKKLFVFNNNIKRDILAYECENKENMIESFHTIYNKYIIWGETFCILCNQNTSEALSFFLFSERIFASKQIPLHLNCSEINDDYNDVLKEKKFSLITYLLAKNLKGNVTDDLCNNLESEFNNTLSQGRKEYILFLEDFDSAKNIINAACNLNYMTKFSNLQIILTAKSKEAVLTDISCLKIKQLETVSLKPILYFDEKADEVRMKFGGKPIKYFVTISPELA